MSNYNETEPYKGYIGSIEYSKEDDVRFGKILGIRDLVLYEETRQGMEYDFQQAVDDYITCCREDDKTPDLPTESDNGWYHIQTAPMDGTTIDLFVYCELTQSFERLPDCYWDSRHKDWMGIGEISEECNMGTCYMPIGGKDNIPGAMATHWRPISSPTNAIETLDYLMEWAGIRSINQS